jgi:hypothetical protein
MPVCYFSEENSVDFITKNLHEAYQKMNIFKKESLNTVLGSSLSVSELNEVRTVHVENIEGRSLPDIEGEKKPRVLHFCVGRYSGKLYAARGCCLQSGAARNHSAAELQSAFGSLEFY